MLHWLQNMNISQRLMACLTVPTSALVLIFGTVIYSQFQSELELIGVRESAKLTPQISDAVHELQRERGKSAGFISSKGKTFSDTLPSQRTRTNQKLEKLKAAFSNFDFASHKANLESSVKAATNKLNRLNEVRSAIDRVGITVPQMASYYTDTINAFLFVVREIQLDSTDDKISKALTAYVSLMHAKEHAGLERAMGAAGFGSGNFSRKIYNRFIREIEAQRILLEEFHEVATKPVIKKFDQTVSPQAMAEINRMRKIALASPETKSLAGITGPQWFAASTKVIDLMKQAEDTAGQAVLNTADEKINSLWYTLILEVVVGLALLAGTLMLAIGMARSISQPFARLNNAMTRMSDGDLDVEIEDAERADEFGEMAKSLVVFRQASLDRKALRTEAAEQQRLADEESQRRAEVSATAVTAIGGALSKLAQGDLTVRITGKLGDHYDELRENFNSSAATLESAFEAVASGTSNIYSGTKEIAQASDDLSRRTENQAATLEETAASVAEITNNVAQSAAGADRAREVVATSKKAAESGGEVVQRAVEAMEGIEKSSDEIGDIIGVIDEIAFQTNLLALNAGVEAARAGDAGRGFAVVASEVRALAQRSAKAAREIKELISSSSEQVDQGVKLVRETGVSLQEIVNGVTEINSLVDEIASSAQDQSLSLEQVNTAVNQLDQVTQENAAMVEQATAASRTLATQTQDLQAQVGRFQIGGAPASVYSSLSTRDQTNFSSAANDDRFVNKQVAVPTVSRGYAMNGTTGAPATFSSGASDDGWEEF